MKRHNLLRSRPEIRFRRRHGLTVLALLVVVSALASTLPLAAAATGKDKLASAIETRLNRLGYTTEPMTASEGYFDRNPVLPQQAFYTYAGCQQAFRFSVLVYKTMAQAALMYEYSYQHAVSIGGDFRSFNMFRRGRVLYLADTAPGPDPNAPSVPTTDFHSLAAGVSGPLPSHPHGCPPNPSAL
jgi:hypothetical protein